jgi:hypothetical protein
MDSNLGLCKLHCNDDMGITTWQKKQQSNQAVAAAVAVTEHNIILYIVIERFKYVHEDVGSLYQT